MTILLLLLTAAVVAAAFALAAALWLFRLVRRIVAVGTIRFDLSRTALHPGEVLEARATVVRRGRPIRAVATLSCTMFDHRERRVFHKQVAMHPVDGHPDKYVARLTMPAHALRTGVVGGELSNLFSEEAHRLLVCWTAGLEVQSPSGTVLARRSRALDLPDGAPLHTDKQFMRRLVVDTFTALRDDLLFNYLVALAVRDGEISPEERELLHEVLRTAHGITTAADADARIERELQRKLRIDPALLRAHVPPEQRADFYRLLFALAWRDGTLGKHEHAFLAETLRHFGLAAHQVREIELAVLREGARRELDDDERAAAAVS